MNPLTLLEQEHLQYYEIRSETAHQTIIKAWNKDIKEMSFHQREGHSVRVLYNNGWGFCHGKDLRTIIPKAIKIAKVMANSHRVEVYNQKSIQATIRPHVKIHPNDISFEEKKNLILQTPVHEKVLNKLVAYQDSIKEKSFKNSFGTTIEETQFYSYVGCQATAKEGHSMETFFHSVGGTQGFELAKTKTQEVVETALQESLLTLKAVIPKGGYYPIVADPGLTDVFTHEAVGHSAEADHILQKVTCFDGMLKQKIAPSYVTIIDDGTKKGSWGSFAYDDEGVPTQKTKIIDKGVLCGLLHSRETAALLKSTPTGNARAESVSEVPQVRMSNTYIEKGDASEEELFEELKNGYYLCGSRGGQVDPAQGTFQFSCQSGYVIKNGEEQERVKGVSIGGHTLQTLHHIALIGKQYHAGMPGMCGKNGQSVPVIGNCPHILINKVKVGGR